MLCELVSLRWRRAMPETSSQTEDSELETGQSNLALSLDDLLTEQAKVSTRAVVEAVPGKPDQVKVTPWIPGLGCLFNLAMELPKDSIDSISQTDQAFHYGGRPMRVVDVKFREEANLPLAEVFHKMVALSSSVLNIAPWQGSGGGQMPSGSSLNIGTGFSPSFLRP